MGCLDTDKLKEVEKALSVSLDMDGAPVSDP
jgi:hypothetical protein